MVNCISNQVSICDDGSMICLLFQAKIRAVHEAVAKGQLREVRSILTRKRFALSRDHVGASPLHLAVLHGHTDVSTYIISHFPETMDGPDNVSLYYK